MTPETVWIHVGAVIVAVSAAAVMSGWVARRATRQLRHAAERSRRGRVNALVAELQRRHESNALHQQDYDKAI